MIFKTIPITAEKRPKINEPIKTLKLANSSTLAFDANRYAAAKESKANINILHQETFN